MKLNKLDQIRAAEARLLIPTYDRNPILFVGGEGVHIIDENGTKYLDLLSGIGVNALGYNHPVIVEAIARQRIRERVISHGVPWSFPAGGL